MNVCTNRIPSRHPFAHIPPKTNTQTDSSSPPPVPTTTNTPTHPHSARDALRQCLPDALRSDVTFAQSLKDDLTINRWLANLLYNLNET